MAKPPILQQVIERARALRGAALNLDALHAGAHAATNRDCDPTDAKAVRFCAYGALVRAGYELTGDADQASDAGRAGRHVR